MVLDRLHGARDPVLFHHLLTLSGFFCFLVDLWEFASFQFDMLKPNFKCRVENMSRVSSRIFFEVPSQ